MDRIWVAWLVLAAMVAGAWRGTRGCMEKEKIGLIELRKAMPPGQFTALPGDSDCCSWDGVHCSATTGRVRNLTVSPVDWKYEGYFLNISLLLPFEELVQLELDWTHFDGLINQEDLMKLTRLETLTFTGNNLSNIASLQAFANMANLKYLDLSHNSMTLTDLEGMCEMKNIVALYLGYNNITAHLPRCIGNLTYLQILDISENEITGNIPLTIGNLSHLSIFSARENNFFGSFSLHYLANNSKLQRLELTGRQNYFQVETETQPWFPSFQLSYLDLSSTRLNKMSGSVIPTFLLHQSELRYIDLSDNDLQDAFPSWLLQNNSKLDILWIRNNSLTGNLILPNFVHGLTFLSASYNKIGGKLPNNMQMFLPALGSVDLSFNSFTGKLPKTLFGDNNALSYVDFSNNLLAGEIYLNLTNHLALSVLDFSNNKLNGTIEELPSSPVKIFDVSNNLISGKLPKSLGGFSSLYALRVSNNYFEGGIPAELCRIITLGHLDVSHNKFSGPIPSCLGNSTIKYLYMQKCSLSGVIPHGLFLNSSLITLDLSYNDFSRSVLPNWIYRQHNLQALIMAGLQLEGEISTQLCDLENIRIMDLSHNNFNGTIPSCLFRRPFWADKNKKSEDVYFDIYIFSFYHLPSRKRLLKVEFTTKGMPIIYEGNPLDLMNGLDLSSNKLSGQIPPQIGDSEAIKALNLSKNRLSGSIPSSISKLRSIESLDLSSNNLNGRIPPEMVHLTFLSTFKVSNNNLSGPIPTGGQFSNFDEQNFVGNQFECRPYLDRHCPTRSSLPTTPPDEQDNDDESIFEVTSFWWSFFGAYIAVFVSLVVIVGIDARCSRVWFGTVDAICSNLFCVFVRLKFVLGIK